jgi:phage terminase large subunit
LNAPAEADGPIPLELAEGIAWLASKPKRVKIAVGGRASTKSTGVGDCMLMFADHGERICCTREFQNSIEESVHENLKLEIDRLSLHTKFIIQASKILAVNGGELFYRGLARNITSLKSIAGVNKLWIEEGESVSKKSLKVLTPSIRTSARDNVVEIDDDDGDPPEIWITMNRGTTKDAVSVKYLKRAEKELARCGRYEDDLVMIVEVNYQDNPWFPPEMEQERSDDFENMPRAEYDAVWNGRYADTVENAIIEPEWFDACIDAHITLGFEALGQERVAYDPADTGDNKAWGHAHGPVIVDVRDTDQGRIDTATDQATSYANDIRPDVFSWDGDGIGMGLKRQIADAFKGKKIELEVFRGGEGCDHPERKYDPVGKDVDIKKQKTNKEMFANKRAQYYWMLRDRCFRTYLAVTKGERVFNPDDLISFSSDIEQLDQLRTEVCTVPRKYVGSGRVQILSKPDMLKLDIDSPNMADVVMMLMRQVEVQKKTEKQTYQGWN